MKHVHRVFSDHPQQIDFIAGFTTFFKEKQELRKVSFTKEGQTPN
jgi:hypothetical protein